jgi:hypothetical protein
MAASVALALLLCIWGIFNVRFAGSRFRQFSAIAPGPLDYTTMEFGQVIRKYVKSTDGAMLAENDLSLPLWYFADRAIKTRVWDLRTFDMRLHDGTSDLCFDITQRWRGEVTAVIIPRAYLDGAIIPFADALGQRFTRHDEQKFVVFEIRAESRGQRAEEGR